MIFVAGAGKSDRPMRDLRDRVAVVTGAGSGIGRALATRLRTEGCALALADLDAASLAQTVTDLPPAPTAVTMHTVDVADRDAMMDFAAQVHDVHRAAHLLFNNAGVAHADLVTHMALDDLEWVMKVNFWGVVYGTKAFLPMMLEQRLGHVVNMSSVFGLVGIPSQAAYCSSKFAVRGFTESLRQEVAEANILVSSVHPGGVRTNILRNARFRRTPSGETALAAVDRFDKMFRLPASEAARLIVHGVKKERARILVGSDAHLLDSVQRLFPVRYAKLIRRALDAYSTP